MSCKERGELESVWRAWRIAWGCIHALAQRGLFESYMKTYKERGWSELPVTRKLGNPAVTVTCMDMVASSRVCLSGHADPAEGLCE